MDKNGSVSASNWFILCYFRLQNCSISSNIGAYIFGAKVCVEAQLVQTYIEPVALCNSFENLGFDQFNGAAIFLTFHSSVAKQQSEALGIELQSLSSFFADEWCEKVHWGVSFRWWVTWEGSSGSDLSDVRRVIGEWCHERSEDNCRRVRLGNFFIF